MIFLIGIVCSPELSSMLNCPFCWLVLIIFIIACVYRRCSEGTECRTYRLCLALSHFVKLSILVCIVYLCPEFLSLV